MPLRAAFFDVGDTLVEHWAPRDRMNELMREALRREFGEREWYDRWIAAEITSTGALTPSTSTRDPMDDAELRQETLRWSADWFRNAQIGIDDIDLDRVRTKMSLPLDLVSTPVAGAFTAVRWCKKKGLSVGLITNTLWRGDEEAWEDWQRFELADAIDAIVTSHSIGWQKPHRQIFERALDLVGVTPAEAVMVGDRLVADIWGAKRLGMRAVWRRTPHPQGEIDVTPDATVDDLTELPAVLEPWLPAPEGAAGERAR